MTPHDDHITADIRLRSRWSLHQKCSPFGRATSYIRKTLTNVKFFILILGSNHTNFFMLQLTFTHATRALQGLYNTVIFELQGPVIHQSTWPRSKTKLYNSITAKSAPLSNMLKLVA
jgi:hypothetical protein